MPNIRSRGTQLLAGAIALVIVAAAFLVVTLATGGPNPQVVSNALELQNSVEQ